MLLIRMAKIVVPNRPPRQRKPTSSRRHALHSAAAGVGQDGARGIGPPGKIEHEKSCMPFPCSVQGFTASGMPRSGQAFRQRDLQLLFLFWRKGCLENPASQTFKLGQDLLRLNLSHKNEQR